MDFYSLFTFMHYIFINNKIISNNNKFLFLHYVEPEISFLFFIHIYALYIYIFYITTL